MAREESSGSLSEEEVTSAPKDVEQQVKENEQRRRQQRLLVAKAKGKRPMTEPKTKSIPTIIIEYFLSDPSRPVLEPKAQELKKELETAIEGIEVKINPDLKSANRYDGWFQVRIEGGEILSNYWNLRRPFQEVSDLDVSKVVNEVKEKVKR